MPWHFPQATTADEIVHRLLRSAVAVRVTGAPRVPVEPKPATGASSTRIAGDCAFSGPGASVIHVRVQTWFPLQIKVYPNGHEWLSRKLATAARTGQSSEWSEASTPRNHLFRPLKAAHMLSHPLAINRNACIKTGATQLTPPPPAVSPGTRGCALRSRQSRCGRRATWSARPLSCGRRRRRCARPHRP